MLSLLCLFNVYKTSTTVTQTTETKGSISEKGKKKIIKTSWERENSPRLCLLALESLTESLWPMELRKTIATATSPSCIVPVAFLATQGPPLRPDGSGGGGPFLCGTGGSLCCWDGWSLLPLSALFLCLSLSLLPPPPSVCIFHSSGCCVCNSV